MSEVLELHDSLVREMLFYKVQKEIAIETADATYYLSIDQTKQLIEFLTKQIEGEMSEKQQTAVEWLVDRLKNHSIDLSNWRLDLIEQAKAMEKEQIMSAFEEGHTDVVNSEQFYSKTYSK